MLLAIDVGNTNITAAVFNGDDIAANYRLTTGTPRTSDEFGMVLTSLLRAGGYDPEDIDSSCIVSVVPDVMHALTGAVVRYFGVNPVIVGPGIKTGIRLIRTNPSEVGADRIVDGAAALAKYGGPCIVIDYGTATTYDYFTADGGFDGAVTCPGIMLSARALWTGAARIPEIEIKMPDTMMAKDTVTSIQAGVVGGRIGEAEYIIDCLKEESGEPSVKVIATGGLAGIIYSATDKIDILDPNLTMYGLKIIYDKNR